MATTPTYDDFLSRLKSSGLESQFSSQDLNLAQQNPGSGLGILAYKQQYNSATTDAQRAAANSGANSLRNTYGDYTAGQYGADFIPGGNAYEVNQLNQQAMNYPDFSFGDAPEYDSRWDDTLTSQLGDINNYGEFNQDVTQSQLYQTYKQQASREADRSYQDTMGSAAALTNGQMSTGALAAASQSRDYQMSKINDQYTNIYNTLYGQYTNQFNMLLEKFASTGKMEDMDYNKFLNELQQYNIDKDFAFNEWSTGFNMLQSNLQNNMTLDQQDWERNYTTGQTNFENQLALGQLGAEFGDFSGIQGLGIDTSAYLNSLTPTVSSGRSYTSNDTTTTTEEDLTDTIPTTNTELNYGSYSEVSRDAKWYKQKGKDNQFIRDYLADRLDAGDIDQAQAAMIVKNLGL